MKKRRLFLYIKNPKRFCAKQIKNFCWLPAVLVCSSLAVTSCRKDLCYDHDAHSLAVRVDVQPHWMQEWEHPYDYNKNGEYDLDWQRIWEEQGWDRSYDEFRPEVADGIRSIAYTGDGKQLTYNLQSDGGLLHLPEGEQDLLFYNNDTEYIIFDGIDNSATATAGTRTRTRATYQAPEGHEGERTITPPDMLYASFVPGYLAEASLTPDGLPTTMYPRTYSYLIRYRFKAGLQYVAQAKGSLAGMADKVYLHDGHTDATSSTLLFDCQVDGQGCTAEVSCFGVPNFAYKTNEYTDDPAKLHGVLTLEVVLKNGKHLSFERDVSDALRAQPRGGVLLFPDIEISDDDGQEGSGGFDANVDDWGDVIEVPLPIH